VLLAIPWDSVESVVGGNDVSGKIIIDCVNPISHQMELVMGCTTSAGESVARLGKGAKVVKAFNTTGFNNMKNPSFGSTQLTMLYAGDDDSAKKVVRQLIQRHRLLSCRCRSAENGSLSGAACHVVDQPVPREETGCCVSAN
jgi:8-hydroxy-5-deazaflavin:NADPH oxidoreductase